MRQCQPLPSTPVPNWQLLTAWGAQTQVLLRKSGYPEPLHTLPPADLYQRGGSKPDPHGEAGLGVPIPIPEQWLLGPRAQGTSRDPSQCFWFQDNS